MNLKNLFFFLATVVLTGALTSCGDDDDYTPDHETLFEIELKVKTDATYRGVQLDLFAPKIHVDWGDGSSPDTHKANGGYTNTLMEHQYPASNTITEYTVKITGKGISSFAIEPDPEHKDVLASIVKSVSFKNCPVLENVTLLGVEEMKSIDFNQLPDLEQLILTATFFTSLDCSGKGSLERISLKNNQLLASVKFPANIETISLTGNPKLTEDILNLKSYKELEHLYLDYTNWESINLSSNKELESLTILNSNLKEIDTKANNELSYLRISKSNLKEIDLSSNKELTYLELDDCDLTKVDLSVHTKLSNLSITYSDVSVIDVPFTGFPSLDYVQVNDNKLDANMLNTIFNALPKKTPPPGTTYSISIHQNPGVTGCATSIAKNKGWTVYGK